MYSKSSNRYKRNSHGNTKRLLPLVLFLAVCVNIIALSSSIYFGATDLSFYGKEFTLLDSKAKTGLNDNDLKSVSKRLADYVGLKTTVFAETVTIDGQKMDYFNDKERAHMVDVQKLFWLDVKIGLSALILLIGFSVIFRKSLGHNHLWSKVFLGCGGVTVLFAGFLGILMATDFSSAFIAFHKMFFSNDLWLLDPETDRMIVLLEEQFFADMALHIVWIYLGATAVVAAIGGVLHMKHRQ